MTAKIIDGKQIASQFKAHIQATIEQHTSQGARPPGLAVLLVNDNPASALYVSKKHQACQAVGIESHNQKCPETTSEAELLAEIDRLNREPKIDGILVQLPLPAHINPNTIVEAIDPRKDVDGFHPYNLGRLAQRHPAMRCCTPYGILHLLKSLDIDLHGQHAVIVGASNIVGRPMGLELLLAGATVTTCHRFTHNLPNFVSQADIVIAAAGKPELVKGEWIKPGAIVIDVGINRTEDGRLVGDVEFAIASQRAGWITPVPGGVGPMTVTMLLQNTLKAWLANIA